MMQHSTACPDPSQTRTYRGSLGDLMTRCQACGRFVVHLETTSAAPTVLTIPPCPPTAYREGWPTHRGKRRAARAARARMAATVEAAS